MAPNDPSNYTWRGKAYRSIEKFDLAIADLTRAIALAPNDPFNYTSRAEVYRSIGDYQRALTDLSRSVELKPDAYVYSLRGRTYDAMKKPDQAIVEYTNALKFAPTEDRRALYLFYRALTYEIISRRTNPPSLTYLQHSNFHQRIPCIISGGEL